MEKKKHILITGGAGFVGSHLADQFLSEEYKVFILDKKRIARKERKKGIKYKKGLVQDKEVQDWVVKIAPDIIFHLAGHADSRASISDPLSDADQNIMGALNILEAARHCEKKPRVIFASSGDSIYGEKDKLPVSEKAKPEPVTPYGIAKFVSEKYALFYENIYGISWMALRLGHVYGPRKSVKNSYGIVAIFADRLMRGEVVYIFGDGNITRDFLYIEDVVRAFIKASESDVNGVVNIGSGQEISVNQIFDAVQQAVGTKTEPEYQEAVLGEIQRSALDYSQAKKILNWSPEVSLEEGIERTVEWYREYL